jgi:1,2-diacylglycerol 3-beta-glucosyltransferase
VIERFGWSAYGLAEDIEYTTTLLDAGVKVEAVPGALLYAQAAQTRKQADSQRMRWEGGRLSLARRDGVRLLRGFFQTGSAARLDWAMDLFTPPMAILVGGPLLMAGLNLCMAILLGASAVSFMAYAWFAVLVGTCIHVMGGLLISEADPRAYLYLLSTPLFLVWKVQVYAAMLLGKGPRGWVRTERTSIP